MLLFFVAVEGKECLWGNAKAPCGASLRRLLRQGHRRRVSVRVAYSRSPPCTEGTVLICAKQWAAGRTRAKRKPSKGLLKPGEGKRGSLYRGNAMFLSFGRKTRCLLQKKRRGDEPYKLGKRGSQETRKQKCTFWFPYRNQCMSDDPDRRHPFALSTGKKWRMSVDRHTNETKTKKIEGE